MVFWVWNPVHRIGGVAIEDDEVSVIEVVCDFNCIAYGSSIALAEAFEGALVDGDTFFCCDFEGPIRGISVGNEKFQAEGLDPINHQSDAFHLVVGGEADNYFAMLDGRQVGSDLGLGCVSECFLKGFPVFRFQSVVNGQTEYSLCCVFPFTTD